MKLGLLSSDMKVTKGTMNSLAGLGDNRGHIQIFAAVQPGNSGGPVLDTAGNVVGVVVAKLDALELARITGSLTENLNFAIASGIARAFLDSQSVPHETTNFDAPIATPDIVQQGMQFTVPIGCWR